MPPNVPPVISKVYDLQLWLMQQVPKFPKSHRFVLGDRIQALGLDILEQLIEAAYTRNKGAVLKQANLQLEKLRYLICMAKDLTFLSVRQYEFVSGCKSCREVSRPRSCAFVGQISKPALPFVVTYLVTLRAGQFTILLR